MSTLDNIAECLNCGEEFRITLEYEGPEGIKKIVDEEKCPECNSKNWKLTDRAEH